MKKILFIILCIICIQVNAQYIGVRARYTDTRQVDDSPKPPKRENRLILSFYEVTFTGNYVWTPVSLTNYDLWVYKEGLQYGNQMGGVLDSTGNNYPGYTYPAPRAVAYYNTLGQNYVDCNPNIATHFIVNGHELDCGFIPVSYHDTDWGTGNAIECFPAPNILLPYYGFGHPYYFLPGNVNFGWGDTPPGAPYNLYNFSCGGPLQLVQRGLLNYDSINIGEPLPVKFAGVKGEISNDDIATISWSNLTETDIASYLVERSLDGTNFNAIGTVIPTKNDGGATDYTFQTLQPESKAFYRIKAVESNGTSFYSSIIVLRQREGPSIPEVEISSLTVFPNPVTSNEFTFQLSNAEKGRYISSVVNAEGKQLRQKLIEHAGGNLIRQVDLSGLPAGIYQLVIRGERRKYSQKILYVH